MAEPGSCVDTRHPIPDHWTRLWHEVQAQLLGARVRESLNELLPPPQAIVARKPLTGIARAYTAYKMS